MESLGWVWEEWWLGPEGQNAPNGVHRQRRRPDVSGLPSLSKALRAKPKRCRRCALPPHSKALRAKSELVPEASPKSRGAARRGGGPGQPEGWTLNHGEACGHTPERSTGGNAEAFLYRGRRGETRTLDRRKRGSVSLPGLRVKLRNLYFPSFFSGFDDGAYDLGGLQARVSRGEGAEALPVRGRLVRF